MSQALIVEQDAKSRRALSRFIETKGFRVHGAGTLKGARQRLRRTPIDVALVGTRLPDGSGLDLARDYLNVGSPEFIFTTDEMDADSAVEAVRARALDYLAKPINTSRLSDLLETVLAGNGAPPVVVEAPASDESTDAREAKAGEDEAGPSEAASVEEVESSLWNGLCVRSAALKDVCHRIERIAPTEETVLFEGETGVGKDMLCRVLHDLSQRREGPFVALNCGAIPETLIDSELFGHERGSFTGSTRRRRGVFEEADGGTLFLDEIGEMPMRSQARLLRVLETHTFRRVGGNQEITVDTRVVAATNRPLADAARQGRLRKDLYYRLNVLPLYVPPLRERPEDIEALARHFLAALNDQYGEDKKISDASIRRLAAGSWEGNVRELRNAIHRAFILSDEEIDVARAEGGWPSEGPGAAGTDGADGLAIKVGMTVREMEYRLIDATLEACDGAKPEAARLLGISLKTLYNRLNEREAARGGGGRRGAR